MVSKKRVLVLNQDFSPLTICTIQRAFLLIFLNKAEMLSSANGHKLRTVNREFPLPAVIRVNRYVKVPYKGVVLSRANIFKRDLHSCQYCGTNKDLTIDHVMPKSRNGKTNWTNLVTACKRCNSRKGDFTPEEAGMPLKRAPFKPNFVVFLRDHAGYDIEEWRPFLFTNKMEQN